MAFCETAKFVSRHRPNIYQWIYTNGVIADENAFKKLADSGILEIRFHLAATNYAEAVVRKLPIARKYFKRYR